MRSIAISAVAVLLLGSCSKTKQQRYYTKEEVQHITDSAKAAHLKIATAAAERDLEVRRTIELKSRMDSIKNAEQR